MKLTVLGCGGSGGVPVAGRESGGSWGLANPRNPRNRRSRVSVLIEGQGAEPGSTTHILIDTSPVSMRNSVVLPLPRKPVSTCTGRRIGVTSIPRQASAAQAMPMNRAPLIHRQSRVGLGTSP